MCLFESVNDWLTARYPIFFYLLNYVHLDVFKILNFFYQSIISSTRLLALFLFILLKYFCIWSKHWCLIRKWHICAIKHLIFTFSSLVYQTNYIITIFIISPHYWFWMINNWPRLIDISHAWSTIAKVLFTWWSRIQILGVFI